MQGIGYVGNEGLRLCRDQQQKVATRTPRLEVQHEIMLCES